jgi:hypothetical protein
MKNIHSFETYSELDSSSVLCVGWWEMSFNHHGNPHHWYVRDFGQINKMILDWNLESDWENFNLLHLETLFASEHLIIILAVSFRYEFPRHVSLIVFSLQLIEI